MRNSLAAFLVICVSGSAAAQAIPIHKNDSPMVDLSAGYDRTQANAPPGICQCFGATGGYGSASFSFNNRFAVEARFSGGATSNISTLGQNLNLYTYLIGPRIAFHVRRLRIFADVLFGEAHGTNSYFPTSNFGHTTSASSSAIEPGGAIDVPLTTHFSVRALEAQYLHTSFANGSSNTQNQLQIGAGIAYNLHRRGSVLESLHPAPEPVETTGGAPRLPPPPPPPPPPLTLDCTADATSVPAGQTVAITGHAAPNPGLVLYTWNTSGGRVLGDGSRVNLDTTELPPGNYTVSGRVAPASSPFNGASCEIDFAVTAPPPLPPPPPVPAPASLSAEEEKNFHANVHDVYFDLNNSILSSEAIQTIRHNSDYLAAHPSLKVLIGGFADQRGSAQYNLALGERRATAVRQQLIDNGVSPDQIQIVTFGRNSQICTAGNERCWQQNRRVAFLSHP